MRSPMRSTLALLLWPALSFALSFPAFPHHGAAAYDMSKPAVFKDAVVTKLFLGQPSHRNFLRCQGR